jgi:hypothetical protein
VGGELFGPYATCRDPLKTKAVGDGVRIACTREKSMTTVQLAIRDSAYAQSLRNLLVRDNAHEVLLVDKPDLSVNGVVVIDGSQFEDFSLRGAQPERFVVIMRKGAHHLSKAWETGVRHVVFEEDSPNTAQLAVMAAELRLPKEPCVALQV